MWGNTRHSISSGDREPPGCRGCSPAPSTEGGGGGLGLEHNLDPTDSTERDSLNGGHSFPRFALKAGGLGSGFFAMTSSTTSASGPLSTSRSSFVRRSPGWEEECRRGGGVTDSSFGLFTSETQRGNSYKPFFAEVTRTRQQRTDIQWICLPADLYPILYRTNHIKFRPTVGSQLDIGTSVNALNDACAHVKKQSMNATELQETTWISWMRCSRL